MIDRGRALGVAEAIRDQILARGHKMSLLTCVDDDPLSMLAYARGVGPAEGADAEQVLRAAEPSAASTTTIAPDALQVIDACHESGSRVAVVSVHCSEAVRAVGDGPADCALVGLSSSAMYAAREAGAHGIGVVNRNENRKHLAGFGAVVVSSLPALASALTTVHPAP